MQDSASKRVPTTKFLPQLDWIDTQDAQMRVLLKEWVSINSGSYNIQGLERLRISIAKHFESLGAECDVIELADQELVASDGTIDRRPLGKALHYVMRPDAEVQAILVGHMDTVFAQDSSFQEISEVSPERWTGPGVADLKGGLVVMLSALQALEKSPYKESIGWQVIINPDEEIGSPGSGPLLMEAACDCDVGLIFEPSLPDGRCVSSRKGSSNLSVVAHGKAAHVGREFDKGASAAAALAEFMVAAHALNDAEEGVIVNIGQMLGGGALNVVPDFALCRLNIRVDEEESLQHCLKRLKAVIDGLNKRPGIKLELTQQTYRPPKPFDAATETLFAQIAACGELLGQDIRWQASGGVCDGNLLAAAGVPTIDTLGVIGAKIHTDEEYIELHSLTTRAKLAALYMMRLGAGELSLPKGDQP